MATGRLPDPNSAPVTAKGDLYTYSTVPAKLAVGSNGETLVADSSTSTGLRWTAGNPQGNPVLNSAFQVWQRGTSLTYNGSQAFIADRWQGYVNGTSMTISRQTTSDTTNLPNIQYCARIQRTASSTNVNSQYLQQNFETINSIPFAGKTVTLSFYARAGANYSPTSSALRAYLVTGTGTDQNWLSTGYTGSGLAIDATATLTTTWQRFTYTGTVPSNNTELTVAFFNTPVGTAGANDWCEITGVQLDIGSVALPFRTYSATLAGELAACQRYYYRIQNDATTSYSHIGIAFSATACLASIPLKSTMRVAPTAVDYASLRLYDTVNAAGGVSAVALDTSSPNVAIVQLTSTGMTAYRNYYILGNTLPSYLGFSAEL